MSNLMPDVLRMSRKVVELLLPDENREYQEHLKFSVNSVLGPDIRRMIARESAGVIDRIVQKFKDEADDDNWGYDRDFEFGPAGIAEVIEEWRGDLLASPSAEEAKPGGGG